MKFAGLWHIVSMEVWDEEYFNMEVQAYLKIGKNSRGEFQFGLVQGQIDGEVVVEGDREYFEFTWDGSDEMDPVSGRGRVRLAGKDELVGRIKIHLGDSSGFSARRGKTPAKKASKSQSRSRR